ncbi:MAG TPA: hypothetical protein VM536_02475 [Chloroflexia bacterium]|nr:hypothetical protein [Chloroflexia bacterium]
MLAEDQNTGTLCKGDWQFLLDEPPQGAVLRVDGCAPTLPAGRFGLVAVAGRPAGWPPRWHGTGLDDLAARVAPGGQLYLEVERPGWQLPPHWVRGRLRRAGLQRVRVYWPRGGLIKPDLWLPLGAPHVERYYLHHLFYATSPARRVVRLALIVVVAAGGLGWTVPSYVMVARRPAQGNTENACGD